jgi:hypothetical protein
LKKYLCVNFAESPRPNKMVTGITGEPAIFKPFPNRVVAARNPDVITPISADVVFYNCIPKLYARSSDKFKNAFLY